MSNEYDDIINLPHHVSKTHPQMSMYQRAAQFAPFAALNGHGAAIEETARITEMQSELDDDANKYLNKCMAVIREHLSLQPEVTITYFQPDDLKSGGRYVVYQGNVRNIDDFEQVVIFTDDFRIPLSAICNIDSKLFDDID